jgi:hypothetical protein
MQDEVFKTHFLRTVLIAYSKQTELCKDRREPDWAFDTREAIKKFIIVELCQSLNFRWASQFWDCRIIGFDELIDYCLVITQRSQAIRASTSLMQFIYRSFMYNKF